MRRRGNMYICLRRLKYLLSGPLQKRLTNACSRALLCDPIGFHLENEKGPGSPCCRCWEYTDSLHGRLSVDAWKTTKSRNLRAWVGLWIVVINKIKWHLNQNQISEGWKLIQVLYIFVRNFVSPWVSKLFAYSNS